MARKRRERKKPHVARTADHGTDIATPTRQTEQAVSAALLPDRRPGGSRAVVATIAAALLFPVVIFLVLAARTSNTETSTVPIKTWRIRGQTIETNGDKVVIQTRNDLDFLKYQIAESDPTFTRFTLDFLAERPLNGQLYLCYRRDDSVDTNQLQLYGLTHFVPRPSEWYKLMIVFDDIPGLQGSSIIGVAVRSSTPGNTVHIRNAQLHAMSFIDRVREMTGALLRHRPLRQSSNNFITPQLILGTGFLFIFWLALAGSAAVLLIRRFVVREKFSLKNHMAITVLVLYICIDLRNTNDHVRHARAAWDQRQASANITEQLRQHETLFPWFADTLHYLKNELPPDGRYHVVSKNPGGKRVDKAFFRIAYYALPARGARRRENASHTLVYNASPGFVKDTATWRLEKTIANEVLVYRRIK